MVGPNYKAPPVPLSEKFSTPSEHVSADSTEQSEWWKEFNDPVLDKLVTMAYEQNLTLRTSHLEPVSPPAFLLRMLSNIHAIAAESDPPLATKIAGWIEALSWSVSAR